MVNLRVLHQVDASIGGAAVEYAQHLRRVEGCFEAEAYSALNEAGGIAVVELWKTQSAYARAWASSPAESSVEEFVGAVAHSPAGSATEFYSHQYFDLDQSWKPVGYEGNRKVFWPNSGGVRVLIQGSRANLEAIRDDIDQNATETNREPGCEQFEWFVGLENSEHTLLLELWRDQAVYDAHWMLRLAATPPNWPMVPAERTLGRNGREFYRHQGFVHLYDRWLPRDVARWSHTIVWPD